MRNLFKGHNATLVNHLFQMLLVTYLVLLLAEQIWTGIVSVYLNLNYLLVIVIIAGVLDVFSEHPIKKEEKIKKRDYFFIFALGILGFTIIKYKTIELGWLSWIISIIAGVLIILLSLLVLEEDDEKQKKQKHHIYRARIVRRFSNITLAIFITIVSLTMLSLGITIFSSLAILESARIVFGSVYVLFLPGFILTFLFFPKSKTFDSEDKEKGTVDWIERIALSFALSIAVVPLAVFYLNLIGVRINLLNSFFTISGIIVFSLGLLYWRSNKQKK